MLEKVKIKNFQRHKELEIDFVKGVNVIRGESDTGKSSLIRAMKWNIENRPQGFAFRHNPSILHKRSKPLKPIDITSVEIIYDNGHVVREKDEKKLNRYVVNGEKFDAIRADIPEEAARLANINYYNVQWQHDTFFMLNETSGEVAKKINGIAGLDIIDSTLKNINSIVSDMQNKLKEHKNDFDEISEQLKQYELLDEIELIISEIEKIDSEILYIDDKTNKINSLVESITNVKNDIDSIKEWLTVQDRLNELQVVIEDISKLENDISIINKIILDIKDIQNDIKNIQLLLNLQEPINEIMDLSMEIDKIDVSIPLISDIIRNINNTKDKLKLEEKRILEKEREYDIMLNKLDVCPLCGNKIKKGE